MLKVNIHSYTYDEKQVLTNIKFNLKKGEHLSILGESGCGKSTLLHLIYGLLQLEKGTIYWGKNQILGPKNTLIPGEKFMKLVAQEFNIMPFITVEENIYSHLTKLDEAVDQLRVKDLLQTVDLEEFGNTLVKNLSGGQKQRVALAKALAQKPNLLLLDEPFSSIDTIRKNKLRRLLYAYLKDNNISSITATHDSDEALAFSDKILLLKEGKNIAFGSPQDVYQNADSPYKKGFFGDVSILPKGLMSSAELLLLPQQLKISEEKTQLQVIIIHNYYKGSYYLIEAMWNEKTIFFNTSEAIPINKKVFLKLI